ncbi:SNF2 family N-terminal domain-containing protein [Massariosphaeria phaeospora]|uniref:SNF2 family N-terminal domain-containing protein n=1 Tax=Massariosphaeria phaeospora TaxID=100035 RepID=A0A7C8M8X1_9PLEO|nr:SNF2 family N-terminal domain-containing protein [Massariosphaeria phaeospora]
MPQTPTPQHPKHYLLPHQKLGLDRLKQWMDDPSAKGGILADEIGLGKTLLAISALATRPPAKGKSAFIVVPAGLMRNWKDELHRSVSPIHFRMLCIHNEREFTRSKAEVSDPTLVSSYDTRW